MWPRRGHAHRLLLLCAGLTAARQHSLLACKISSFCASQTRMQVTLLLFDPTIKTICVQETSHLHRADERGRVVVTGHAWRDEDALIDHLPRVDPHRIPPPFVGHLLITKHHNVEAAAGMQSNCTVQ